MPRFFDFSVALIQVTAAIAWTANEKVLRLYKNNYIFIIKLVSISSRDCQTFSGRSDHIMYRPGALKSRI